MTELPELELDLPVPTPTAASLVPPTDGGHLDRTPSTVAQLEEEGDVAADYIEELLDIADIDGDIELDVRGGRAHVRVESEDPASLALLANPETVRSLQELTRLAVQNRTGRFSRLILDIAGSRDTRQAELGQLVDRAIERIEEGASQASLPAMSSYERKLVHDFVADRGFTAESYGEGAERHTVVRRA